MIPIPIPTLYLVAESRNNRMQNAEIKNPQVHLNVENRQRLLHLDANIHNVNVNCIYYAAPGVFDHQLCTIKFTI
jgi:hypothetical protein